MKLGKIELAIIPLCAVLILVWTSATVMNLRACVSEGFALGLSQLAWHA
jgi:hypothetical protein